MLFESKSFKSYDSIVSMQYIWLFLERTLNDTLKDTLKDFLINTFQFVNL